MRTPLILGHRGAIFPNNTPYQNTLEAYRYAITHADGFECDACLSADGSVVMVHESAFVNGHVRYALDEHLSAQSIHTANGHRLDQMRSGTIQTLLLKDGSPLPTLEDTLQLMQTYPGKTLNLELKSNDVHIPVMAVLKRAFKAGLAPDDIIISSFNHDMLAATREHLPHVRLGALFVAEHDARAPLYPWDSTSQATYTPLDEASLSDVRLDRIAPDFIIIPHTAASPQQVALIQRIRPQAQLIAWVYTEVGGQSGAMIERIWPHLYAAIVDDPKNFTAPTS